MFCFASEILTVKRTGRYVCHLFLNFLRRLANVSCISFFSSTSAHASFPVCLFVDRKFVANVSLRYYKDV